MRPLLARVGISLALIGLIALPLACKRARRVCGPTGCGKIIGQVIGADGPIEGVQLYAQPWGRRIPVTVEQMYALTDDEGRYTLHLPPGPYRLNAFRREPDWWSYAWTATRPVPDLSDADTVYVMKGGDCVRADFAFGGMEIRVLCPVELDNASLVFEATEITPAGGEPRRSELVPCGQSVAFTTLPQSRYFIRAHVTTGPRKVWSDVWLPSALHPSGADTIAVRALESTRVEVALAEPAYVRGRVHGWWKEAAGHSRIILYGQDKRQEVAFEWIGDSGEFDIPVFGAGTMRLSTIIGGPRRWYGGTCFEDAKVLEIEPGTEVRVDSIGVSCLSYETQGAPEWEPPAARLSFYDSTGAPVFIREPGWGWPLVAPLCGLAPGTYFVCIKPTASQGWRPQWYDRATSLEEATPIVIASETDRVDIAFRLEEGGKIRGRILDTETRIVRRLVCASAPEFNWHPDEMWWADSTGHFQMEGLPDGDIKIGATRWNHCVDVTWYPGTKDPDSAEVITIENAGTVEGFEWTLLPGRQR